MPKDTNLESLAKSTRDALTAWRDDVNVRLHLAGMEVRDAWNAAQPHLELAEARLRGAIETEAAKLSATKDDEDLGKAYQDVRTAFKNLGPSLDVIGDDLAKAGRELIARFDRDTDKAA